VHSRKKTAGFGLGVDPTGTIRHLIFDHEDPPPVERKDLIGDEKAQTLLARLDAE
jgi:hypothetical protein